MRNEVKDTRQRAERCIFLGIIGFVIIVIFIIVFRINNVKTCNITMIDTIELICDVNINDSNEISVHKLTVAGCPDTEKEFVEGIPPVISQSFDLITDGTIENIENIVLFMHINGSTEAVKYDSAYAFLEKIDIGRHDK